MLISGCVLAGGVTAAPTAKLTDTVRIAGFAPAAEIVTVSLYVPAASAPVTACTETTNVPVPEVAPSTSHGCVFAAVQLSVPPPLFEIVIACAVGLAPPAVAENPSVAGVAETPGGTAAPATVNVTATVFVAGLAPAAEIVTVSVYVPAASAPVAACTESDALPVPAVEPSTSQACVFDAVQLSVPPPLFEMAIACAAGLLPLAVAENPSVAGDAEMPGATEAAEIDRLTLIVAGDPVAPGAVTVTAPPYVPAAMPARFALTRRAPLPVPEAGETLNHG